MRLRSNNPKRRNLCSMRIDAGTAAWLIGDGVMPEHVLDRMVANMRLEVALLNAGANTDGIVSLDAARKPRALPSPTSDLDLAA